MSAALNRRRLKCRLLNHLPAPQGHHGLQVQGRVVLDVAESDLPLRRRREEAVNVQCDRLWQRESAELCRVGGGLVVVFTARAPGKETDNEDAAAVMPSGPDGCVLAVADGAGGHSGGTRASGLAIRSLKSAVESDADPSSGIREAILDGIEQAGEKIRGLGIGAATTVAVAEIRDRSLRPCHVGDSTILVVGQRGKVKLMTVAHSPTGYAVEAGLLGDKEAVQHEDRHLVSNMVGDEDLRMELGAPMTLAPRDTVVLATDGLFDNLYVEEVADLVRKGKLEDVARDLARACLGRMHSNDEARPSKPDDLTFILYRTIPARRGRPNG